MGKPGSGKSTYLAKEARKAMKKGLKVYSNVYMKNCYQVDMKDLGVQNFEDALIVIDEAGFEMNSRNHKQFPHELYRFFTMHRHYNLDVILAVQYWDRLDLAVRELLSKIVVCLPTIVPFTIKYKQISIKIGISEEKQIVEEFSWKFLSTRYFLPYRERTLFDSFYRDVLRTDKKFKLYNNLEYPIPTYPLIIKENILRKYGGIKAFFKEGKYKTLLQFRANKKVPVSLPQEESPEHYEVTQFKKPLSISFIKNKEDA